MYIEEKNKQNKILLKLVEMVTKFLDYYCKYKQQSNI